MRFERIATTDLPTIASVAGLGAEDVAFLVRTSYEYHTWLDAYEQAIDRGYNPPEPTWELEAKLEQARHLMAMYLPNDKNIALPWKALDDMVGPVTAGEIITVAGCSSVGKTTFTMNLLARLQKRGTRSLAALTEMTRRELRGYLLGMDNHFAPDCCVVDDWIGATFGQLSEEEYRARMEQSAAHYTKAAALTPESQVYYLRPKGQLAASRLAHLFEQCDDEGRELLVIDHLMMLNHDLPARGNFQAEQKTLYHIKDLAEKHDVAVLLVAQINMTRYREGDAYARYAPPQMHHIYGGQQLSFISTVVLGLYRPMKTNLDGTAMEAAVVRDALRSGDGDVLYKPNVTGVVGMKMRRTRGNRAHPKGELVYRNGYLLDEDETMQDWLTRAPAILRHAGDAKEDA